MSSLQPVVSIPAHLKANFRRTMILGVVVGAVGLVALVLTGHPLLGLFGCLGILLGAVNAALVQRSAVTYGNSDNADMPAKKLLTMSIATRLLITTLVAVLIGIFFAPNAAGRYSIGTKTKDLKYGPDGSLTIYVQADPPPDDLLANWLPAPRQADENGDFSLYLRAYWPKAAVLEGAWTPPPVENAN